MNTLADILLYYLLWLTMLALIVVAVVSIGFIWKRRHKRKIKTAEKILFVTALIYLVGIVLIWIPNITKNRETSCYNPCANNLRLIDAAKEQAGMDIGWTNGTACNSASNTLIINMYLKGNTTPICPQKGKYTYGPIGEKPTCSAKGHDTIY